MVQKPTAAVVRTLRAITTALRARARVVWGVTALVSAFNLAAPVVVLSVARKAPDFITFNPWLPRLPEYLASNEPLMEKLSFLSGMVIGWVSADNKGEGIEWGFIIDVPTLARILLTSLVFGAYFALWSYRRGQREASGLTAKAARPAGIAGAVTSLIGLSTAPCALLGDLPVMPVVGLAFTGLSSGALTCFSTLSQISFVVVLAAMSLAVLWLGWQTGGTPRPSVAEAAG